MKMNIFVVIGLLWVTVLTVFAIGDVGDLYCTKPYILEWTIVPKNFFTVFAPLFLGYLGGKIE